MKCRDLLVESGIWDPDAEPEAELAVGVAKALPRWMEDKTLVEQLAAQPWMDKTLVEQIEKLKVLLR